MPVIIDRLQTWLLAPAAHKRRSLRYHARAAWKRVLPGVPLPLRLAPGVWWIAENDATSDDIAAGTFEIPERRFLEGFLRQGMVIVDVGAHAGFYTLLASTLVGGAGRVIAFEPSPRERARLGRHLRLNRCRNVMVEPVALGDRDGTADLLVFDQVRTGCNSFRLADTQGTRPITVSVRRLDDCVDATRYPKVDFVKMDIEGAELSALRGAEALFRTRRPVLLCELHEKRTAPWGYAAREIVDLVAGWGYRWCAIGERGQLEPMDTRRTSFFCNGVAWPVER